MLPKTSIKFVPAEYHSQSAIAAAFELRPQIGDSKRIREIEIATFRTAVEIIGKDPEKWRPQTRETADHSLPYCTAVALVDGAITAEQFTPERLRDPALLDLVARTRVVEDAKLTAGYPVGIPNRVTVTLDDGRKLVALVEFPPGHDHNPLSDEQLAVKFHGLVDPVLGPGCAAQILERVSRLEDDEAPHETLKLTTKA
jgi:2-methylcitrate dehydratase